MKKHSSKIHQKDSQAEYLSIGALASASGIPVETLRNWERRYGFPAPMRLISGHRRYHWEIVSRLTKIRQVLELGYKPSFAVVADIEELDAILACRRPSYAAGDKDEDAVSRNHQEEEAEEIDRWLDLVLQMDAQRLNNLFDKSWVKLGARQFINRMVVPFLHEVGRRWEDGSFTVAHEHFGSEVLQTFLASHWRPMSARARNGKVVLANLEGEFHSLRLHIAAALLAMHDFEPIFLGPNTPVADIVRAANEIGVHSVVIGLAPSSDLDAAHDQFEEIMMQISTDVFLIFGGNEHLYVTEQARYIETFDEFEDWCAFQANR